MKKVRLHYTMHKNDNGNALTLVFNNKGEQADFLKTFLSTPLDALNFNLEPLYGFGKIPYSASFEK